MTAVDVRDVRQADRMGKRPARGREHRRGRGAGKGTEGRLGADVAVAVDWRRGVGSLSLLRWLPPADP